MIRAKEPYLKSAHKIKLTNSLGGAREEFLPSDSSAEPEVKMYVCGLTPYDHAHMGHASVALRFDVVRRYIEYRNLKLNYVENVTDIDDKIINRAIETKEDPMAITRRYTDEYYACLKELGVKPPTHLVRVTEQIEQIKRYTQELIASGAAYVTAEGNVYFEVAKKSDYGKLSNQNVAELISGVRKDNDERKKSPLDFALWKRDESSPLCCDSAWGKGRPGWHIECSVMIHSLLGDQIDIHGGGLDLKFPHHENEIAQSEAHSQKPPFARYWLHGGLLQVNGQKMSKSLGNFVSLRDALELYGPELMRFAFLRHHYRSTIDLTEELFRENLNSLCDFYWVLDLVEKRYPDFKKAALDGSICDGVRAEFESAMNNDFNTPAALVTLQQAVSQVAEGLKKKELAPELISLAHLVSELGQILGLYQREKDDVISQALRFYSKLRKQTLMSAADIEAKLQARTDARKAKDFAKGDAIRAELLTLGFDVLDGPGGSTWRFA